MNSDSRYQHRAGQGEGMAPQMALSGNSDRHREMMLQIAHMFPGAKLDVQLLPGFVADVVLPGDFVFVVKAQCSPLPRREWDAETLAYTRQGITVLWVWDLGYVCPGATRFEDVDHRRGWVLPEAVAQYAQLISCIGHRFYVLDNSGRLRCCHQDQRTGRLAFGRTPRRPRTVGAGAHLALAWLDEGKFWLDGPDITPPPTPAEQRGRDEIEARKRASYRR